MHDVTMALHSNLRTQKWELYEDDKHFLQASIGRFASNLKTALRTAIGMVERPNRKPKQQRRQKMDGLGELKKRLMEVLQGKY